MRIATKPTEEQKHFMKAFYLQEPQAADSLLPNPGARVVSYRGDRRHESIFSRAPRGPLLCQQGAASLRTSSPTARCPRRPPRSLPGANTTHGGFTPGGGGAGRPRAPRAAPGHAHWRVTAPVRAGHRGPPGAAATHARWAGRGPQSPPPPAAPRPAAPPPRMRSGPTGKGEGGKGEELESSLLLQVGGLRSG